MKHPKQILYGLLVSAVLALLIPLTAWAAPTVQTSACTETYTVQADDWLSKIADKFLGDTLAYPAIAAATNEAHAGDASFAAITNPDEIEVGWKVCIPSAEQAQALLAAAAPTALEPANLTVFAAASLTEAFNEIGQNFTAEHPEVTFTFNFAGSQQLAQQLGQGAPADVFASANKKQMDVTIEAGRVVSGTQKTFARNRLVVIYPKDNPAGLAQLQDLAKPGLKLILAAKEVPVGQYALDFLTKAITDTAFSPTYMDEVLKNVVSYEDNVKAVLTKISLGEGDAGIVYTSDISGESADRVGRLDIPDNLNTVATYPIAVVNDSAAPKQAQAFVDYVLGPAGQEVLTRYGFIPVSPAAAAPTAQTTVTDAMGRLIQFAQPPQRIAVAGKGIFMVADALYMFPEAKARVTTMPRGGQSTNDFLGLVDPGYNQKTFFEGDVGPEQIAATKPDAVVLKSIVAEKLGQPLEQLGLPIVYVDLETPEQYFKDIVTLGQLFSNTAQAQTITTFYQSRLDRVSQALQGLPEDQKPAVLVLQYSDKGGEVAFNVPPTGWIQTTMVTLAGGQPVWTEASQGGGWTVVNFEQIAAWNPDQVFIINYTSDVEATVAQLKADPQWQGLKAVQAGQLYAFPKDYYSWDQPDTRWILGLTWLAKTIHPDRFADLDMTQEIGGFYQQLYGLDETAVKDTILPLLSGDVK